MPPALTRVRPAPRATRLARIALVVTAACGAWARADGQTGTASAGSTFSAPLWAFPVRAPGPAAPPPDTAERLHVPKSRRAFTAVQVADRFGLPDWFPAAHPPMPPAVAHGRRPYVNACAYCHLADGRGRPENAALAGLPAEYIVAQVAEMKSGERRPALPGVSPPFDNMRVIAEHATAEEVEEAARYFSALRFGKARTRVVESDSIPRMQPLFGVHAIGGPGGVGPAVEPLGQRLLEATTDLVRHERHDPTVPYVAYVPRGSVARGRAIATAGASPSVKACASCHGAGLRGAAAAPPIAGRSPSYILRQLLAFRAGTRASAAAAPMREVAAALSLDDMIAASAYAASVRP